MGPEESVKVERPPNAIARDFWWEGGERGSERRKREKEGSRSEYNEGGKREREIERNRKKERKKDCRGTKRESAVEGGGMGIWARNACRVINAPCYARSLWIWPNQWPIALTSCVPLCSPFCSPPSLYGTAKWTAAGSLGLSVYPWCWTLPGYKVHPMFDAGGDVRFDALADRLIFIGLRARTVKADERAKINSENEV